MMWQETVEDRVTGEDPMITVVLLLSPFLLKLMFHQTVFQFHQTLFHHLAPPGYTPSTLFHD